MLYQFGVVRVKKKILFDFFVLFYFVYKKNKYIYIMTNYKKDAHTHTHTHIDKVGAIVKTDLCWITEILLRSTTKFHKFRRNIVIFKYCIKKDW